MANRPSKNKVLRVVELFAGVGGFRLGLERASTKGSGFQVVLSNQWEPGRKVQHASDVYVARFGGDHHLNADISAVSAGDIPDHDLLVGGFPCQDYSVASTLKNSKGLVGKKGVLWWQIHRILREKKVPPPYLLLENVDRLLGSPVGQRGRDLAVMLRSLDLLGYAVEWRVINAADYGMPQRRRRVFLVGYHKSTALYRTIVEAHPTQVLSDAGIMAKAFPCTLEQDASTVDIAKALETLSKSFGEGRDTTPFKNAGFMCNGKVHTGKVVAKYAGTRTMLGDVLQPEAEVPDEFFIAKEELEGWKYHKGSKKEPRVSRANGFKYDYAEGAMAFPDPLDRPSRTIITGEGGRSPSRFKHVVCVDGVRYRRLTPVELERLNMFPDGHTEGVSSAWRAFFMGNALVVGVVERIAKVLLKAET